MSAQNDHITLFEKPRKFFQLLQIFKTSEGFFAIYDLLEEEKQNGNAKR